MLFRILVYLIYIDSEFNNPLIASLPNTSFYATTEYSSACAAYGAAYGTGLSWCSLYSASELETHVGQEYLQIDLLNAAQIIAVGTKSGVYS